MLARDYCDAAGRKKGKPIILSHHMLYGLKAGQAKMSKSDPDSAIFMEDSTADVRRKIRGAYCPRTADAAVARDAEMQLAADDLKNPCLDYVRHVVFAAPGATFAAGGATFASADAVRDAFVGGALSEADLKDGLADAVDALLAPVRAHFERDARAAALLARVRAYKARPDTAAPAWAAPAQASRRRALAAAADVAVGDAARVVVAFAPAPRLQCPLADAARHARGLADALRADAGAVGVVYCSDWAALAVDAAGADAKAIAACHRRYVRAVRALADLYAPGVGARVGAVAQSAVALARPSDYWIDVIAAGRRVRLADAQRAAGQRADDEGARVGAVVAALMRCADVAAACADVVVDDGGAGGALALARTFWAEDDRGGAAAYAPPRVAAAAPPPPLTLDAAAAAAGDENAAFWVGDGPDAAKRKLKKAFCEPGNADANPPLALGAALVESGLVAALAVARAPENGGDARYGAGDLDRLVADVAAARLHPGDLKPAVAAALRESVLAASAAAADYPDAKKDAACLKALAKKLARAKKSS